MAGVLKTTFGLKKSPQFENDVCFCRCVSVSVCPLLTYAGLCVCVCVPTEQCGGSASGTPAQSVGASAQPGGLQQGVGRQEDAAQVLQPIRGDQTR